MEGEEVASSEGELLTNCHQDEKPFLNGEMNGTNSAKDTMNDSCLMDDDDDELLDTMEPGFDLEDSWLYESLVKAQRQTPQKLPQTPEAWLKEDISTPELMRVRGSLSAKLEVIAIESRRRSSNSRRDSYEGRKISKSRKYDMFSSNMSLDWDFDDESMDLTNDYENNDSQHDAHSESMHSISEDSPLRRPVKQAWEERREKENHRPITLDWSEDEDEDYEVDDDLRPMKLNFVDSQNALHGDEKPSNLTKLKAVPRGSQVAKSVARPSNNAAIRPRTSGGGQLKPRGASPNFMHKSHSANEIPSNNAESLKVNLPVGNGAVVRRRVAPAPVESSSVPQKRAVPRSLQGDIPQVRRSTGSIPQKREIAKPRRSESPSGIARPRASPLAQSYQR